jgi:hypothetical protein
MGPEGFRIADLGQGIQHLLGHPKLQIPFGLTLKMFESDSISGHHA